MGAVPGGHHPPSPAADIHPLTEVGEAGGEAGRGVEGPHEDGPGVPNGTIEAPAVHGAVQVHPAVPAGLHHDHAVGGGGGHGVEDGLPVLHGDELELTRVAGRGGPLGWAAGVLLDEHHVTVCHVERGSDDRGADVVHRDRNGRVELSPGERVGEEGSGPDDPVRGAEGEPRVGTDPRDPEAVVHPSHHAHHRGAVVRGPAGAEDPGVVRVQDLDVGQVLVRIKTTLDVHHVDAVSVVACVVVHVQVVDAGGRGGPIALLGREVVADGSRAEGRSFTDRGGVGVFDDAETPERVEGHQQRAFAEGLGQLDGVVQVEVGQLPARPLLAVLSQLIQVLLSGSHEGGDLASEDLQPHLEGAESLVDETGRQLETIASEQGLRVQGRCVHLQPAVAQADGGPLMQLHRPDPRIEALGDGPEGTWWQDHAGVQFSGLVGRLCRRAHGPVDDPGLQDLSMCGAGPGQGEHRGDRQHEPDSATQCGCPIDEVLVHDDLLGS